MSRDWFLWTRNRLAATLVFGAPLLWAAHGCRQTPSPVANPPSSNLRPPVVHIVDVRPVDGSPCTPGAPCVIPAGVQFEIRFTAEAPDGVPITGYQWQVRWPRELDWQSAFCDSDRFLPAGLDSLVGYWGGLADSSCDASAWRQGCYGADSHTRIWTRGPGFVSVRYRAAVSGLLQFRARARDSALHVSSFDSAMTSVEMNIAPDTRIERIPACDCPHPPPGCGAQDSVRVGWITSDDSLVEWPRAQWIRFCAGDTIPPGLVVRFFARGSDDPRDLGCGPGESLRFSYRFGWSRGAVVSQSMPFSHSTPEADLVSGTGAPWRGGSIGWGETCPVDYTFYATDVDPMGRFDASPDSIRFYGDHPPSIDSLEVPAVFVLVPTCRDTTPALCPGATVAFGRDTVVVRGQPVADVSTPPRTPLRVGWDDFTLPIHAWGHDHPADIAADRSVTHAHSLVRAWYYSIDCVEPGCGDFALGSENYWLPAVPAGGLESEFDGISAIRVQLDTVTTLATGQPQIVSVLGPLPHGAMQIRIQARDTSSGSEWCSEPLTLDYPKETTPRQVNEFGRVSPPATRRFVLRELREVRPIVQKPRRR